MEQLLWRGCALGLANRIKANPEILTQFKPCAYLAAAIVEWNVPMVRLLSALCVLRNNKRCVCYPNCFLESTRRVRGSKSLLDMAMARAKGSQTIASAAVVMILTYRAGLPLAASMFAAVKELDLARMAAARKTIFLMWALRQSCGWLDKNVLRIIAKKVFVQKLAELTAA